MTKERQDIMHGIMCRMLSHEIDNQKMWLKKSIEKYADTPEMEKQLTSEREYIIGIINEYMDENGISYNPLAYLSYE